MALSQSRSRREHGNIPPSALRHSPRRLRSAAMEEPHSSLTSNQTSRSEICRTNPIRPSCSRGCEKGILSSTNIDSLPDEMLLDILLRVSAEDIHENVRLVCWRWKRIVHGDAFAYAHLHHTGYGLLLTRLHHDSPTFVAATQGGGIEVSELSLKPKFLSRASCNGLIPINSVNTNYIDYIFNPATKGCFKLPKDCKLSKFCSDLEYIGLAYSAASMEYKEVATYYCCPMLAKCDILTVGVDSAWRHVATEQLSPKANQLLLGDPLITEGFIHWAHCYDNTVVTLNVETEVFAETPAPLSPLDYPCGGGIYHFLSTGRHLSVLIYCGDFSWEVWEMKGGSGEWRKVRPNVDLKDHKSRIQQLALIDNVFLRPVGWVKYPEVLLFFFNYTRTLLKFRANCFCPVYNLDKNEIGYVKLPADTSLRKAIVHKKSLVCVS